MRMFIAFSKQQHFGNNSMPINRKMGTFQNRIFYSNENKLQLYVTIWINFTNKTLRGKIKQQKTACRMIPLLQSSRTKLSKISLQKRGKIKFLSKNIGMINRKLNIGEEAGGWEREEYMFSFNDVGIIVILQLNL